MSRIRFTEKLVTLIKDDVPRELRQELAEAAAEAVEGDESYPLLESLAMDLGVVCPWCGRLHHDPEHEELAKAYWQEIATCGCHKSDLVCVKTGFRFLHVDTGRARTGDLFRCLKHGTLAIFGVNKHGFEPYSGMSEYRGEVNELSGNYDSATLGTVTLNEDDRSYVERL